MKKPRGDAKLKTLPDALQAKRSSAGFQTIVSNTIAAPVAINMVVSGTSADVKIFGCRPMMTAPRTPRVGVRKPPREMLWGGGEGIASIVADLNRWSAPCRSVTI